MDSSISNQFVTSVISPEKRLQHSLRALSKCMSSIVVEQMSCCLCRSRTITEFEVQVIKSRVTDTQRASQLMQVVIRKGRSACQRFFDCLGICNPALFEKVTGSRVTELAHEDHHHLDRDIISERQNNLPAYIIHIHNSTLSKCIIGNNNEQHIVYEHQSLLSQTEDYIPGTDSEAHSLCDQQMAIQNSTKAQTVQIEGSYLENAIIGDCNTMVISQDSEQSEFEENDVVDLNE